MVEIGGREYLNMTEAGKAIGRSRWGWSYMRSRGEVPAPAFEDGPRVQYWRRETVERVAEAMRARIPASDLREWLRIADEVDRVRAQGGGE